MDRMQQAEQISSKLESFRGLILAKKELSCPTDDEFLLKFLRAKSFNLDKSYTTLKKYTDMRKQIGAYNPQLVQNELSIGMVEILKNKDVHGRTPFFLDFGKWNTQEVPCRKWLLTNFLTLEEMISSVETQENGVVFVADLAGFTFSHCTSFGIKDIIAYVGVCQGSFPFRLKKVHLLNAPKVFHILYRIVYPMLTKKMKERVAFHYQLEDSFYPDLPREILPLSVGGHLNNEEAFDNDYVSRLLAKDEYFKSTTDIICAKNN